MIKEILRHLFIENLSIGETAQEMNISSESLKEMIRNMEHMGYVEVVHDDANMACSACQSCGSTQACHTENGYLAGKKLVLTEKGKRMCSRIEG